MKKRNVMTMALSLAMVGVIGAGATLAYFADSDGAVTNSFTFAGGGDGNAITVTLNEVVPAAPGGDASAASKMSGKGYDYTNVVPGDTLDKMPTVSVDSDIDCYVFLKVTENDDVKVKWLEENTAWTEIEDADLLPGESVYYYSGTKSQNGVIAAGETVLISSDVTEEALFTEVEVQTTAEADSEGKLDDVTIKVAAIQATGFTSAQDAYDNSGDDLVFEG